MKNVETYQKRVQDIIDAVSFKEPKKVPVGMEFIMWPFAYAGKTYKEVMDDPELTAKTYTKFLDDISLDYVALMSGVSVPVKSYQALGSNDYVIADDDTCIEHVQAEGQYITVKDYDDLIKDPDYFSKEIMVKKRLPAFNLSRQEAYSKLKEAAIEYKKFKFANELINREIYDQRGIVSLSGGSTLMYYSAFNSLFDKYRGITGALTDLRRRPDIVREACKAIMEDTLKTMNEKPEDYIDRPFPLAMTVYHSECFISPEQFDEFFFKDFKEIYLPFMEAGAKFFLKGEGRFINTIDRYRQLPKGAIVMMLDEDDPFEMYKAIGDWAVLATGIQSDLLKYGTKQQCIDYVKKCFDTFAPGGGFIFLQNKPLLCAEDANSENLIAVYEFANEYGKKSLQRKSQ